MSSKTSKKSTTTTHHIITKTAQSPQVSTSFSERGDSERPSSPLSPTRLTRIQEKQELQHLNDRLAAYIERVRELQVENDRLSIQVQNSQETVKKEITTVKSLYEQELSDARKLLDETAKEKAKVQIDAGKWKSELDEVQLKLNKKEKDLAATEKKLLNSEVQNQDLQSRLNQAVSDRKRFEDELKEVQAERDKLAKQLATSKSQLEDETLNRVDLENRLQSLKEELTFKDSVHEKEMSETRSFQQTEITEIDGQLKEQYDQQLANTLMNLREQYETQMKVNRDEIETIYEKKIAELQKLVDQHSSTATSARDELRTFKTQFDNLSLKIGDLESKNMSLQNRIKDLEQLLEQERDWHQNAMQAKEDELKKLKEQMEQQIADYRDLLDIKVALDLELAAYRKLLEGEENRLNISHEKSVINVEKSRSTPVRRTPVRGTKRKRTIVQQSEHKSSSDFSVSGSAKGDIEITEHNQEGKFVKIHNKGSKEVALGSWQLVRHAGEEETIYKFHRNLLIKPDTTLTVWSSDSGVAHNPTGGDVVMKGQKWVINDTMTTTLLNANGEEVAIYETSKKKLVSLAERTTDSGTFLDPSMQSAREEDIYHQQGDPENPERCTLM